MGFFDNIPTAQTLDDIPTIGSEPNLAEQQDTSNSPASGPAAPLAAEVEANLGIDQSLQTLEDQTLQEQPVLTPEQQALLAAEAAHTPQAAEAARIAASASNPNTGSEDPRDPETIIEELFQNMFSSLDETLNEDSGEKGIMFNLIKLVFNKIVNEEETSETEPDPATQEPAQPEEPRRNRRRESRRARQEQPAAVQPAAAQPPTPEQQPIVNPTNIDTTNLTPEQIQHFEYLRQNGFNQPQLLRLHANLGANIPLDSFLKYSSAIVEAALRNSMPPSFMLLFTLATILHESRFNPNLENSFGFGGLGQHPQRYWETDNGTGRGQRLMQEYPEYTTLPSRFDPIASIRATVFYYKNILSSIGTNPSSMLSYNQQTLARDLYAAYNLGPGLAQEFKYLSNMQREQVAQIARMPISQRIAAHPQLGTGNIPAYLYQRIANPYNGRSQTTAFDRVQNTYNQYAQILNTAA